jgi:CHRD domain
MVSLMSDGTVYVNIHTDELQDGAIRGQIASGLPEMETNITSSVVSNTTSGQG